MFRRFLTKMKVFTDGSCRGPQDQRRAGAGVWIPETRQAFASNVPGTQTNNRAELCAIVLALMAVEGPLEIYSDSSYSIKCVTEWYLKWKKNGWRNAKGQPVENQEIIRAILSEMEGRKVKFVHVRGHQKSDSYEALNNQMADTICNTQTLGKGVEAKVEEFDFADDTFDAF